MVTTLPSQRNSRLDEDADEQERREVKDSPRRA